MIGEPSEQRFGQNGPGPSLIVRILLGLVELWLAAIVLILGIAFVMGLFGANPEAPFAQWIAARTDDIMFPFSGLFDSIRLTGDFVIQPALLFAMAVYGAIGAIVRAVSARVTV